MKMRSHLMKLLRELPARKQLKLTAIPSILFHSIGYLRGLYALRQFEHQLQAAPQNNLRIVAEIVKANSQSEFGRQHGFATLDLSHSDAAFKAAVPFQTYADLEPAIERIRNGEQNILCADPVEFFSVSSGTTGLGKTIPTTKRLRKALTRAYVDLTNAVPATQIPGAAAPSRGLYMGSAASRIQYSEAGIPMGAASSEALSRVRRIAPLLWSSPWPVFEVADTPSQWYLHALFALQEPQLTYLRGTFAGHLAGWLAFIVEHQAELVNDIALGTIKKTLNVTPAARAALLAIHKPDLARAAALRKAFAAGEDFVRRVWPQISYAAAVITGSFAAYLPALKRYLGDVPIYTTVYGASETPIALNIEVERPERYVLLVGLAYFEFIPLEAVKEQQPQSYGLEALTVGHSYEPVITNWAGLYRYRLGDIVRVEGYHHHAPILSFSHRIGTLLDLAAEKVSEAQVLQALQGTLRAQAGEGTLMIDYTTYPCVTTTPPRYEFYLELSRDGVDRSALEREIDAALGTINAVYASVRKGDILLGPPIVKCLAPGSFEALTNAREAADPHIGRNQLKTPRVLTNDGWRAFLDGRIISQPSQTEQVL